MESKVCIVKEVTSGYRGWECIHLIDGKYEESGD